MPRKTLTKKIYGVLGFPLKHSLSPAMQNAALAYLKINAEYRLFEVPPDEIDAFFSKLKTKGIHGLNVTVPYKEKAFGFVKIDPQEAHLKKIGAVNTIVKVGSAWMGFNTDIAGFTKHINEHIDLRQKRAALLGAGGASRAVSYALAHSGVQEIAIFDLDGKKSALVSAMIHELFPYLKVYAAENIDGLNIKDKDLLINATPIGLKSTDPCLLKKEDLHPGLFVYDLIYNPARTRLLELAESAGARVSNGLGMLLYQGAFSFQYFTGKIAPVRKMRRALESALKKT
jgi:shikimate dehydrogenase